MLWFSDRETHGLEIFVGGNKYLNPMAHDTLLVRALDGSNIFQRCGWGNLVIAGFVPGVLEDG